MRARRRELLTSCIVIVILLACNFPQRFLFNLAGPQAPADIVATLAKPGTTAPTVGFNAPVDGLPDAASCDATAYVSVRVGERFTPRDSGSCYQDMVIANTHASLPVLVLGHHAGTTGNAGSGRLVQPQSESSDQWSVVYPEGSFSVDWYTAIFATPECIWLDGVRESEFEQLPSLGLTTVPVSVPSCSE